MVVSKSCCQRNNPTGRTTDTAAFHHSTGSSFRLRGTSLGRRVCRLSGRLGSKICVFVWHAISAEICRFVGVTTFIWWGKKQVVCFWKKGPALSARLAETLNLQLDDIFTEATTFNVDVTSLCSFLGKDGPWRRAVPPFRRLQRHGGIPHEREHHPGGRGRARPGARAFCDGRVDCVSW